MKSWNIYAAKTVMRSAISAKRRLAITLYFLASTAEYRTIANLFGVSRPFVCLCVRDVSKVIISKLSHVVSFAHGDELVQIINDYEQRWGFPMCAGAIDGTHIPITAPSECHAEYVNRKGYHSIIMQAVVDCKYLYRDVVIGWPGSVHDARVFSNSSIFKKGNAGHAISRWPHCGNRSRNVTVYSSGSCLPSLAMGFERFSKERRPDEKRTSV